MAYRFDKLCGLFHNQSLRYGENHVFLMGKYDEHGNPLGRYRSVTWAQDRRQSMDLARGLVSPGVEKEDRCVIFAESRPEWIIADQAVQACGATGVPLYAGLRRNRETPEALPVVTMESWDGPRPQNVYGFADVMLKGRAEVAADVLVERIRSVTPEDIAAIICTSGSTGRPKGVVLTRDNFMDAPCSEETGELTPTLKVKRKVVNERFSDRIEKMHRN